MAEGDGLVVEPGSNAPVDPAPASAETPSEPTPSAEPSEPSADKSEPPIQNRVGELERRLARAEERALAAENARDESAQSVDHVKQAIAAALTGEQRSETAPDSAGQAPDIFQDQAQHDAWVARKAREEAQSVTSEQLAQFKAEQEAATRDALRSERSTRAAEEFKASRDWLSDPEQDAEFAKFVNERIAPTGEDYSLTVEDLENAELLFRKDEIMAERTSEARSDAVRTIMNRQQREPAARVSSQPFSEQSAAEQAEAILSSDQASAEALLAQVPPEKLMAVLEQIDPDSQPLR